MDTPLTPRDVLAVIATTIIGACLGLYLLARLFAWFAAKGKNFNL